MLILIIYNFLSLVPTKEKMVQTYQKNVECFKGKDLMEKLLASPFFQGDILKPSMLLTSEQSVISFCDDLIKEGYFHRGKWVEVPFKSKEKGEIKKRRLQPDEDNFSFANDDTPFIWVYNNPSKYSFWLGALVLLGFLACVLMPIWFIAFYKKLYCVITTISKRYYRFSPKDYIYKHTLHACTRTLIYIYIYYAV